MSNDFAIKVEKLSKRYRIGLKEEMHDTLGGALASWIKSPFSNFSRLQKLSKFGEKDDGEDIIWALKDVSFNVKHGEVVGIIGRNGAGKSTLLKILSHITEPTSGRAIINGRVSSLLEVGTGFHPELTGRENIYLNGTILGMSKREVDSKFDEIVAFSEIGKFLDTPVKRYSSGMGVRLAFAVAAHLEPEILVVDEVLAVGDTAFQKKCLGRMGDVAREGRTVLFVSHNMGAIEDLCKRAILIQEGYITEDSLPKEVVSHYLGDAFTSTNGVYDFSHHPARPSKCQPLIKKVILRTPGGAPTNTFYPDDHVQAEFWIEPTSIIREPRVAFSIEDHLGRRILTAASYFSGKSLPDFDGPTKVICNLPQLNLGSGKYLISVSIATKYTGLLDLVDSAASIEIGWRNNYGSGEPYFAVYGPVLVESDWEIKS